jgi:hypothetical protein
MADLENPGGTAPPASGLSPEERTERESLRATIGALNPHADAIRRVVEDEDLRKYVERYGSDEGFRSYLGESTKYYDDLQQRKPASTSTKKKTSKKSKKSKKSHAAKHASHKAKSSKHRAPASSKSKKKHTKATKGKKGKKKSKRSADY